MVDNQTRLGEAGHRASMGGNKEPKEVIGEMVRVVQWNLISNEDLAFGTMKVISGFSLYQEENI